MATARDLLTRLKTGGGPILKGITFKDIPRDTDGTLTDAQFVPDSKYDPLLGRWVIPSGSIEINTKGSWLDHWDGPRRLYGDYSDDQFRAMLIGHELGHAYDLVEALGGFGVRKHADFDQRILEECFK